MTIVVEFSHGNYRNEYLIARLNFETYCRNQTLGSEIMAMEPRAPKLKPSTSKSLNDKENKIFLVDMATLNLEKTILPPGPPPQIYAQNLKPINEKSPT
jgi:hypothetical protein